MSFLSLSGSLGMELLLLLLTGDASWCVLSSCAGGCDDVAACDRLKPRTPSDGDSGWSCCNALWEYPIDWRKVAAGSSCASLDEVRWAWESQHT